MDWYRERPSPSKSDPPPWPPIHGCFHSGLVGGSVYRYCPSHESVAEPGQTEHIKVIKSHQKNLEERNITPTVSPPRLILRIKRLTKPNI